MEEQWYQWKPVQGLSKKYYIESISHSMARLIIILYQAEDTELRVVFNLYDHVVSYRVTDESFQRDTIYFLENHYGTSFYGDWTLFKIKNSSYLESILKSSDSTKFTHFCFLGADFIVDIVATYEPKITFL